LKAQQFHPEVLSAEKKKKKMPSFERVIQAETKHHAENKIVSRQKKCVLDTTVKYFFLDIT